MKPGNNHEGQSTLEILIALAILVLTISAVILVAFGNQSVTLDTELNNQALYVARSQLENARAAALQDFTLVTSTSSSDGFYFKQTIVEDVDAYTKKVTARISWQTGPLRLQEITLATIVTDRKTVQATGGDTGGSGLSGDWQNPQTLGSIDLGAGNSATDLDALNKIVYLTTEASDSKKKDFYIVDATNGQSPVIVSSIDTGPGPCPSSCGPGLNTIDTAGNYAYVGSKDTNSQLQIIDVSDKNNPFVKKSFKLPGVSGNGAVGYSIFFYDSRVYIGTKKATGPEFHIIDVTDPQNPTSLGSKEINADVGAIYINGSTAYLATSDENELQVFDVSNPANITLLGSFDALGSSEDGKSAQLVGNKLYLGRTVGGNHDDHHEFHIVDVTNPASMQGLGSKDLGADLNDLRVRDYLAFFATSDSNKEFQIWNISDPANITLWSSFNFPQVGTGIDYEDNLVYVSVRSNDALRIITSSP